MNFVDYVLKEVREKRLQKAEALELIREHKTGKAREPRAPLEESVDRETPVEPVVQESARRSGITLVPMAERPGESQIRKVLRSSLAEVLYMAEADIDDKQPFIDMGLDSIVGVEWVNQLNRTFGLSLSATKVYDYPNIETFAAFLSSETVQESAESRLAEVAEARDEPARKQADDSGPCKQKVLSSEPEASLQDSRSAPAYEPIAIVGMSGRYPGASDLKEFWNNLVCGRSSISEVPRSRWDMDRYYDPEPDNLGNIYCRWIGALADVDCFDPLFFRISPTEAAAMDPQQRIFLQEAHKVFEMGGYSGSRLDGVNCGVYLGIMNNDYGYLSCARDGALQPDELMVSGTSNSFAIAAARISYHLNLRGPAIAVDTACSSSLVAAHLACRALQSGDIDMALVGGVTLYLSPQSYISMCASRMLSPEGKCKVFDDAADGFVPGEGVGTVVLKRLKDAERDGDRILGLIVASGINQDGRTNGLTAPSANSQKELMSSIYRKCGVDTNGITYVETHGTGTKLGDPIELEALGSVFKERSVRNNYCALGSVKSNIGHTSAAAGMASLHKVLLSLRHQLLVPTLNFSDPNRHFDFLNSPFYVNTEVRYWDKDRASRRRAAISSFGFSGTNSHIVIEEYVEATADARRSPARPPAVAIVLSARSTECLNAYAANLLAWLRNSVTRTHDELVDLAYTLQIGREAMEERLGIIASSSSDLEARLNEFLKGSRRQEGVYSGRVSDRSGDAVEIRAGAEVERLASVLEQWVAGRSVDWREMYGGERRPRVIDAPTYPFAKQRYWVGGEQRARQGESRRDLYANLIRDLSERRISVEEAVELSLGGG